MLANPYDWQVVKRYHGKIVECRLERDSGKLTFRETWDENMMLEQAAQERELASYGHSKDMKPMAVVPDSVMNRAINEGWANDQTAWRRWINDSDHSRLRVTSGRV